MEDVFALYREALEKGHRAVMEGRPRDALAHYGDAARLADDRPLPHVCIGGVLLRTRRPKEALAAYGRALERAPDDPGALAGKAAALLASGRRDEAAAVRARLEELERASPEQRREVADGAALRDAEQAGGLSRPDLLAMQAEAARRAGRGQAAIDAWLESAAEYAAAGYLDAALDSAQSALLIAPGAPRVHLALGRLYILRGWSERAVERLVLLDRLLRLEPDAELASALTSLAGDHAGAHPALAALAAGREPGPVAQA